jgi:hypothetical protein
LTLFEFILIGNELFTSLMVGDGAER